MTTATSTPPASLTRRARWASLLQRYGVLAALALLVIFGALRYEGFLSVYNVSTVLSYNSMFGLIALGMTFVIISGGIDLSVGSVAAFASVIAALLSPFGLWPALLGAVAAAAILGLINGLLIAYARILPFITTLAMLLAARGLALLFAGNQSVSVDYERNFTTFGQGNLLGVPYTALVLFAAFALGALILRSSTFGRHVLAVGGNEEAARLMGLNVERIKVLVYTLSGALAGLAGVILASQFGAGQPTEGLGWELTAIAAVVVGGTLLTGGLGSVGSSLVGVLLLGIIFNILNFENGRGTISLSAYWQSVIRGAFLLLVVVLQNQLTRRRS
ncbi:ABC transporter permease [Deinococcus peraridilitoris]|uniref:Permease component of ribose/xylose/arabinose/galactoside ABC-type transporters n=1 Tax=Deinococcus peraridilitoris (strain DSM 19664 / LMG 22246 / CIP 109416 / KR-200) TaxID=937777 RepID=L0A2V7_DEIPD|nr:ABC transporter permease [Deinococcus peraridilitoris]AFZ67522.1 permease component of ribose/xylose/arabinose/galactoside ABC-type transporters [Deinococcus peraridilitoris DSM 19664]